MAGSHLDERPAAMQNLGWMISQSKKTKCPPPLDSKESKCLAELSFQQLNGTSTYSVLSSSDLLNSCSTCNAMLFIRKKLPRNPKPSISWSNEALHLISCKPHFNFTL